MGTVPRAARGLGRSRSSSRRLHRPWVAQNTQLCGEGETREVLIHPKRDACLPGVAQRREGAAQCSDCDILWEYLSSNLQRKKVCNCSSPYKVKN